ncbi:MAG: uncharacterized protein JWN72_2056 [Thermoleophilia bacterium]|nr:uncharacterized protein [Thermoleophilia bacterium]
MCGRYQLALPGRSLAAYLDAHLGAMSHLAEPTWNAAPSQALPVVALAPSGERVLEMATWGLTPAWARQPGRDPWKPLINARAETVATKPAFRTALRQRRVLVPATGFYEWVGPPGNKAAHAIRVQGDVVDFETGEIGGRAAAISETAVPFLMAGIAEVWVDADNVPSLNYAVITTTANELVHPIHARMPVILEGEDARLWLDTPPEATDLLMELLRPFPAERMEEWEVPRDVNSAHNDGPHLVTPAGLF